MTKENVTEFIILGLLTHESSSGYDLKKKIDLTISNFWEVGYGQLYPTLKALQAEGCVTGTVTPSSKGPERIQYSITERGSQKLSRWLDRPGQKESVKYEMLIKLFFGAHLPIDENLTRIEQFKKSSQEKSILMEKYKENLRQVLVDDLDHVYFYLTVLFGEHMYRAYTAWADEALDFLAAYRKSDV